MVARGERCSCGTAVLGAASGSLVGNGICALASPPHSATDNATPMIL
jgi:hypothetical protein